MITIFSLNFNTAHVTQVIIENFIFVKVLIKYTHIVHNEMKNILVK